MKQIRKTDSDGNLVVKMQITDLPYVNGLMSILEKYADELPKEMVAELLALPVGD